MQIDDDKADKIISLLENILSALTTPAQQYEDQHPWAIKIIHEFNTGEDRDGNDLVYGEDFIFAEPVDSHPLMMQNVAMEVGLKWGTKKRITFLEYYKSLPSGATKDKVMVFLKKLDAKRS